jgi:hypothetical protein
MIWFAPVGLVPVVENGLPKIVVHPFRKPPMREYRVDVTKFLTIKSQALSPCGNSTLFVMYVS